MDKVWTTFQENTNVNSNTDTIDPSAQRVSCWDRCLVESAEFDVILLTLVTETVSYLSSQASGMMPISPWEPFSIWRSLSLVDLRATLTDKFLWFEATILLGHRQSAISSSSCWTSESWSSRMVSSSSESATLWWLHSLSTFCWASRTSHLVSQIVLYH